MSTSSNTTKVYAARRPDRAPTHPGAILREDVLPGLHMSVIEAARHLRISRQTLHRILAEKGSVTPEMAVRLGKFCGNGPGLWLRMQLAFDLWQAERQLRGQIEQIPTFK
jgi:antitoxin HigA-1